MGTGYVHGFSAGEARRLHDQARTLEELLHAGTTYPDGAEVLEAGCGVGAQTVPLALNSPGARITAIDASEESIGAARARADALGIANAHIQQADVLSLPFADGAFDHVFVCFLLEHVADPAAALLALRRALRPGGTITIIEGDHGSAFFHPDSAAARRVIACQVALQRGAGGDALVGRQLRPLVAAAGFLSVAVEPRTVYVDAGSPELVEGFIRRTFVAMVAGLRERAIASKLIDAALFDEGIEALERTTGADGMFCYTFFKATAVKG